MKLGLLPLLPRFAAVALCLCTLAGCSTFPDTQALISRHAGQTARFESARGPLSERRSAAIVAQLKRSSGDLDILDKQIALEQEVVGRPLVVGNKVSLLRDGAQTYPAMLAAIRAATNHIHLQTYIIEDDAVGRQFSDALLQKQAQGIQVTVIYDSVGAIRTPRAFFERLRVGGVQLLEFSPVNAFTALAPWKIYNRDHRKLLVVDGRIAFIGGINISSVYSSGSGAALTRAPGEDPVAWRDTHIQLEGPVVAELQKLFLQTWEKQRGKPLTGNSYFPKLTAQGNEIVRAIGSTPDDPYSLIYLTLISAIGNAEKQIYVTNAYFVPDPQLLKALGDAAARGVDVRLILPSRSDSSVVFHAGRSYYTGLLAAGVKLYERMGAVLHAKSAVIDGVWSTVGSTNLDSRSFLDNDEINAVILGRDFGQKMQAMFADDLRASQPVDKDAWEQRPAQLKLKEWAARLWGRLL